MTKKSTLFVAFLLFFISASVASCGIDSIVPSGDDGSIPTITPASRPSVMHRNKITALFCDDSTGSYRRAFFNAGRQTVADSFLNAVQAGQDGITLYVTTINLDTVGPDNSIDPPLQLPQTADYPPHVTVVPYKTVQNQLSQGDADSNVDATNTVGISIYNNQVAAVTKQVQDTKAIANKEVSRLLSWNPHEDDRGTSVFGCLYLVKSRLQITQDIKQLIIASDLEDNVSTTLTSDFVQSQGLKGVSVHVIDLPGTTQDNTKRAKWCAFFRSAGAAAIKIDDTDTSANLHDLFNADLDLRTTGCP